MCETRSTYPSLRANPLCQQLWNSREEIGSFKGLHWTETPQCCPSERNVPTTCLTRCPNRTGLRKSVQHSSFTAGFWHCVLGDESSFLTTFSNPQGRYRWLRLPFGLSVSSEIFEKRVNQALEGLHGVLDITDDILIYGVGRDEKEANVDHDKKLRALL